MKYRPLGKTSLNASVVGIGAWVMGGGVIWGANPDDAESIRAIQTALDQGVNLIDTAPAYGWGRSEEVVGKAIKGRRERVIVATKCGLWWDDERGSFFANFNGKVMRRSLLPDTLAIEIDRSLKLLDIECIDLYQTHWPSAPPDLTPVQDSMAFLSKLKDQGKIRAIGVSNVTLPELEEDCRWGDVVSNQLRYSLLNRDADQEILPFCQQHQLSTLTYMSLEQGLLSGKIGMDRIFTQEEFRSDSYWNPWFLLPNRRRVLDLLAGWRGLTDKYACSLAQLVIAWTAAQPGITHVLCGARRAEQAQENAAAADLALAVEDLAKMRSDVEALGQPAVPPS